MECLEGCEYKEFGVDWIDGNIYLGQTKKGYRHGRGALIELLPSGAAIKIYEGYWSKNERHGKGRRIWFDGN